jgi:hypothetical protein
VLTILSNTFVSSRRGKNAERFADGYDEEDGRFSLFEQLHQPFLRWWSNPEQALINKLLRSDSGRNAGASGGDRALPPQPRTFAAAARPLQSGRRMRPHHPLDQQGSTSMSEPRLLRCEEVVADLLTFLDGEIDHGKRARIEEHLEICHGCCSRAEFERALRSKVSELGEARVSSRLERRVRSIINEF